MNITCSYSSVGETAADLITGDVVYCVVFMADEDGPVVECSVTYTDIEDTFVWHDQSLVEGGANNWTGI